MTNFAVGPSQANDRLVDADSESRCDLGQRVSLNFFQEKYIAVGLAQSEGSQDRALESSWTLQSGDGFPDFREQNRRCRAASNCVAGFHILCNSAEFSHFVTRAVMLKIRALYSK